MERIAHIVTICIVSTTWVNMLHAQSNEFTYQMILETKLEYNDVSKNSTVNPNNDMGINQFNSASQFYPILGFKNAVNNTVSVLQVEGNITNYNFEQDSTHFSMQELYGQISFGYKHYLTFGKKRLDWGSGMIWNPTNFFVQKDPLRTQNRLEGIFMFNYTYILKNGEFNLYIFPDKTSKDFKMAVKYNYAGNNRFDASISFLEYNEYQQFGMDLSYGGDYFTAYTEGVIKNFTQSYGIESNGQLVTPEEKNGRFFPEWVVGTSVLLSPKLTFSAEYRYRCDQLNRTEMDVYKSNLLGNEVLYDPISIGRQTLYGNLAYNDIYGRWSANLRSFYDPISKQLIVSPLGILTIHNFQAELSTIIYNKSFSYLDFQTQLLVSYSF